MQEGFSFGPAEPKDMEAIFGLIDARIQWLAGKGIDQWDKEVYWKVYPKSYYENARAQQQLFVLRRDSDHTVVGTVVLIDSDPRWKTEDPARYIHNLATSPAVKGAGKAILQACEEAARRQGCCYLRLDCVRSNEKLNRYYEAQGFAYVEPFDEGAYLGNKREKRLEPQACGEGGACT